MNILCTFRLFMYGYVTHGEKEEDNSPKNVNNAL